MILKSYKHNTVIYMHILLFIFEFAKEYIEYMCEWSEDDHCLESKFGFAPCLPIHVCETISTRFPQASGQ
jgi:hypothetical protein